MTISNITFREYPKSVKYGISFVIISWIFFIFSHSIYTGNVSLLHLTMGTLVCFLVYSLKNWGRIFTIVYNTFMAGAIGVELYYHASVGSFTSFMPFIIKGVSILLFLCSSLSLITPAARNFYGQYGR